MLQLANKLKLTTEFRQTMEYAAQLGGDNFTQGKFCGTLPVSFCMTTSIAIK